MSEDCKSIPISSINQKPQPLDITGLKSSVFFDKFSGLLENYESNIVFDSNRQIDMDLLNENTKLLNKFVREQKVFIGDEVFSSNYPDLYQRLETNINITPFETQRIIEENLFTAEIFELYLAPSNARKVLSQVNAYYGTGSVSGNSMGSFCSLVGNVFGALNGLRDAFDDIMGFAEDFSNIIQSIQNFSLEGFAVAALLENLKQKILGVVDQLVAKIKARLQNFSSSFMNAVGSFRSSITSIADKISTVKSEIEDFLSEDTIEALKKKIEGLISYASSLFEDPTIEVIQFLILRFCEFIGELESFFNNLTNPLEQIAGTFQNSYNQLQSAGNAATSRALAAGAIRFPQQERSTGIETTRSSPSSPPPARLRRRAENIDPPTPEEIDELPSWEEISSGSNRYFTYSSGQGRVGWTRAQTLEKVMLLRLAKAWGSRFNINSAFRTREYNNSLDGSATNSMHLTGQAFDIGITSDEFVDLALSIGFGGIGRYNSFTHVDSRPHARWDRRG